MSLVTGLMLVATVLWCATARAADAQTSLPDRLDQEFRDPLDPALEIFGTGPLATVGTDRSGLRISLAADRRKEEGAGVATRFQISGDFEITLAYELRSVKQPEKGFGAGLKIWLTTGNAQRRAITFAHFRRPKDENQRVAFIAFWDEAGKKTFDQKSFDTTVTRGQLRLIRTGSAVRFLAADENSTEFQELYEAEISPEDIETMRIQATSSAAAVPVDVGLQRLTIRAEKLSIGGQRKPESRWPRWSVAIVGISAGIICLILIRRWMASRE